MLIVLSAGVASAQDIAPDAGTDPLDSDAAVRQPDLDASVPDIAAPDAAPLEPQPEQATEPEPPPRGDVPVSLESVVDPDAPAEPPPAEDAGAPPEADAGPPPQPTKPEPTKPGKPKPAKPTKPEPPPAPTQAPIPERLIVWAAASWAASLGPGRCADRGIERADVAVRIASTLKRSVAVAGVAVAPSGALADHPLIAHAAKHTPDLLADLLAEIGFSAVAVGVQDLNGPLLREPQLSNALRRRNVTVIASNLQCGGEAWCEAWATAEDPLPVLERNGRRIALISVLPDDVLARVEPAAGRSLELHSAADTLVERTAEARRAGLDLVVASMDHGPDATASVNLANFLAELPPDIRPDLLLSPSAGDNLLFMRPLDVHPAVVGTRSGVLTGLRVTKLPETNDADVFARSVRVDDWDDAIARKLGGLGANYCQERGKPLPGGLLDAAMKSDELIQFAADAVRELAVADLAVVDPLVYDGSFSQPKSTELQRGQIERAVVLDSPLVVADVTLDWIANLQKVLTGLRPLRLFGTGNDRGDAVIAGRLPVTGALYRVVTTAVLARSGRLPDGPNWSPLEGPSTTLRGALLGKLNVKSADDPRTRIHDPIESTQWVFRADGQVQANLTAVDNPANADGDPAYDEPELQVNESKQLGVRLLLNLDADAPDFLFENALQVAFDRNFTTETTAQDLLFYQTTYTYRGLWPEVLLYPHPFVEAYVETEFDQDASPYHHLLLRPEAGLRSMVSRALSIKLSAGFQYEVLQPDSKIYPGAGAELLLKPSTLALPNGSLQIEGSIVYYWNAPGTLDEHTLRAQLITAIQLIGPLQLTLSTLAALSKEPTVNFGKGLAVQAGLRLRFVERSMVE